MTAHVKIKAKKKTLCPECGHEITDGKFCPVCGKYMPSYSVETVSAPAGDEPLPEETETAEVSEEAGTYITDCSENADSLPKAVSPDTKGEYADYGAFRAECAAQPCGDRTPSVWSFILTFIIGLIPVVGLIYFICLAFGITDYPAKKNLARAMFLFIFIVAVISSIVWLIYANSFYSGFMFR